MGNISAARMATQATSKLVTQTQAAVGELQITCAAIKVCKLCQILQNAGPSLRGSSPRGLSGFCNKRKTWSDFIDDPALSRRLDQRPPVVSSNLNYSMIL